jgi:hypothetical protein
MAAADLAYLKKRAEFLAGAPDSFGDEKVRAALAKIAPPRIRIDCAPAENNGFECVVHNKLFRNWIDLIPESDRGFIGFSYSDGNDADIDKYLRAAMTMPAWEKFRSAVSADAGDSDMFAARWLVWHSAVLGRPVGFDFGNYEMNAIFNSLPVDISKNKMKFGRELSFAGFYRTIKFAEWCLNAR